MEHNHAVDNIMLGVGHSLVPMTSPSLTKSYQPLTLHLVKQSLKYYYGCCALINYIYQNIVPI